VKAVEFQIPNGEDDSIGGIFTMLPDGQLASCNSTFARIFGFDSLEQAQEANFTALLRNRKDATELTELLRKRGAVELHEIEMRKRDGEPLYMVGRFTGRFDKVGQLVELSGFVLNDTKRKRLEEQLVQAQRMEGLGTLAGGIAHDFNNILAIILGYTTRLESWRSIPDEIPGALKAIHDAVERGAALVQQLLTSARQTEARLSSFDLNSLVSDLEKMLRATFPKTITFDLRLELNLPFITADRSQIDQVLLNLCVNARDAMPNGGVITLDTSITSGAELREFFTGANAEEYTRVRVRDTGAGIPPEVKTHIFEPFFTTKERSKGTGLGLSVVYGVVNNHRGFVQVESEPGAGATFSIYLPLAQAHELSGEQQGELPIRPFSAQNILLVEDEEMLRDLGITMLTAEGYRVFAAKDGVEAVEMFEAHRDEIGLVVCDLGLPRLGGRDAFMKMKESKPGVRVIVASGYLEPGIRSEILKAGVVDTIQKPYEFRDLVEKIRAVIGEPEADDNQPRLF
jgi:signal transduction histidine kinase/ActR/RegA family two-component response regulator